ncbi:MAG TPA: translocation/assembly module TamB domain-containing protein [Acetobacteraceae bacterium]|nr:translocation/assembly module TamB domain-containing protein [Acetobacteraceae bacterium]
MRRIGKILAWTVAVIVGVPLLLVAVVLIGGNTAPGQRWIAGLTPDLTGGQIHITGLSGRFPDRLRAATLEIDDKGGPYLTVHDLVFDWSPLQLLHTALDIDRVDATDVDFARMPQSSGGTQSSAGGSSSSLPVTVTLHRFQVDHLTIGAPVAGKSYVLGVSGAANLQSETAGSGRLTVQQMGGSGRYTLTGSISAEHLQATITANEQAHGLISGVAGLPDIGPIAINATLDGPRDAVATHLTTSAGPLRAQADGTVDLVHEAADLTVNASAPAMTPSPDISWQDVTVSAHAEGPFKAPELTGQVRIDALKAEGAGVSRLTANLSGNQGTAHLQAAFDGLTLPGQAPALLAAAPVQLDATAQLAAPGRPVTFTLQHPLVQVQGTARTAGALSAHVVVTLPELAPVAAAAGQQVQGHTSLTLDVAKQDATMSIALQGTIGITGGQQQAQALLGNEAHVDLAASLTGRDARLTRLHVTGRGVDVAAHGSLENMQADLDWTLAVTDLAAVDPSLTGAINATGHVGGPEQDLAATVDLHGNVGTKGVESGPLTVRIAAQGLPKHPSGTVTAQGALLNAPVDLAADVSEQDGAIHVAVQRASWKSLQAGGALTLPSGARIPEGSLHVRMARLGDLAPLLHQALAGSIEAALDATQSTAKLTLTAQGLAMPGTAAVQRAALDATVTNPQSNPDVQASLTVDGVTAGSVANASAKVQMRGPQNALAMTVSANAPDVSGGAARLNAALTVNAQAKSIALSSLQAAWKQETVRLLAPATVSLGTGAAIGNLRLGLRQAVLAVNGRVSPTLDLTASLRDLPADLASVAVPSVSAAGTIGAEVRLTGSLARPGGTVRLTATGLRDRSGTGAGLPPANIVANATLQGTTAQIDMRLTAGTSRVTLTGTVPLATTGTLDLHAVSALDLGLLNPVLTAQGRRVSGEFAADATIGGTAAAPRIAGTARLTGGDVQDYTQGVHIADISALVRADGDRITLAQLSGRAGQGTLGGSGTIGLTAPMPINLTITADNATLLASPLITAALDSHMTIQGDVDGTLAVAGTLGVRQANVQIPDKLPSSVAVIPVRVAGAPVKPAPAPKAAQAAVPEPVRTITLNITLNAPRRVFIRGRGLDVELGGTVHVRGTADQPVPSGGLNLIRGSLSLVGQTLTFTSGSIDFIGNGISDPGIHLVATSYTSAMVATLTVSGTAKNPKITLSSVPDMPQDQILAQLLFHQVESSLSPFQIAEIAAGLAQLSGSTSGMDPLAKLRSGLGLDQLSIGSDAAGNPALQAGRYVAKGVYLGAQQATGSNGTQATVQVDLTKRLKLVTTAGSPTPTPTGATPTGQAASVGLTYQFQY